MRLLKTSFVTVISLFLATCAPAMAEVGLSGFELIKVDPPALMSLDIEQVEFTQDIAPNIADEDGSKVFELYALQGDPYSQVVELDFEPLVKQIHFTTSPPSLHILNFKSSNVSFEVGWLNS
ncbi:MAG: hypothetical protein COB78_05720 [Hyphomicrobiales bacterium]|nr:MAG: hypothetical protein COB78_05720 [Hyphomicrobiales bacterium]